MRFGYCVNMLARDEYGAGYEWIPKLGALGYDYIDLPMAQMMAMDDAAFAKKVVQPLRAAELPCLCTNNLFPASLRLTGAEADHTAALEYARRAFDRAEQLGAQYAVFGSSGARNVPMGFPRVEAIAQIEDFLPKLADIADAHGVTLVIEPLNRAESNILMSLREGLALCRKAGHLRVRMLCDLYHMALSGEDAGTLPILGDTLRHVHIARPLGRVLPADGDGEDYAAFFAALCALNYDGGVSIEAYAPEENREDALRDTLAYLRRQL